MAFVGMIWDMTHCEVWIIHLAGIIMPFQRQRLWKSDFGLILEHICYTSENQCEIMLRLCPDSHLCLSYKFQALLLEIAQMLPGYTILNTIEALSLAYPGGVCLNDCNSNVIPYEIYNSQKAFELRPFSVPAWSQMKCSFMSKD